MSNEMELSYVIERNLRKQMDVLLHPKQLRALFSRAMGALPTPEDVRFEPVMAGDVLVEWMVPEGVPEDKTLMHFHGGGYMVGSPIDYREMVPRLARAAGAKGLVPDYRTSPEYKCPAARDDCVAAYRWHLENGGSPERTVVTGDSAGGGLVLTTLVALKEQGIPLPAAAVCISPWAELEMLGGSVEANADKDPFLDRSLLEKLADAYLQGQDSRHPGAAPLYSDLGGLSPILIQVGSVEILLDDAKRLAEKAKADGTEVTLEVWDDAPHVWHWFASFLPEARQAIDRVGEFCRSKMT